MKWIKASERLPEKDGYYITTSEWAGDGTLTPYDRSDTYFSKGTFVSGSNWRVIEWLDESRTISEGAEERGWVEPIAAELKYIRNKLYDKLPTGKVKSFELIKIIKSHLLALDSFIDTYNHFLNNKKAPTNEMDKC